eukprot:3056275-Pyramimonas_sp.AAC.1
MTDEGCESLSADLATDGARTIPDQALRDLGRELSAGAPEIQTDNGVARDASATSMPISMSTSARCVRTLSRSARR